MARRLQRGAGSDEATFVGREVVLEGTLHGKGLLRIEGRVQGQIEHEGTIVIGEQGYVKATVRVKEIVIHGQVEGDIFADRCEVAATARVTGDMHVQKLAVAEGAMLAGGWSVSQAEHKPED